MIREKTFKQRSYSRSRMNFISLKQSNRLKSALHFCGLNSAELGDFAAIAPRIIMASAAGKRLIIAGENFDPGAVILLNGEGQKTKNDDQNPTSALIGKKSGKRVKPGDRLQVRNPDGTLSQEFTFTRS